MITGGIKFFEKSKTLGVDGATMQASSGDASSIYALDRNPVTIWRSVGSNDLTTETLTISFTGSKTMNRIFLLDINWKQFVVQYDLGGVWTSFTNVRGLDSTLVGISETVFADSSAYYEFDSVTTTKIRIQVLKTQIVNAQKYLSQFIGTTELGTFQGFPDIDSMDLDRNAKSVKTLSGKYSVQKGDETIGFQLKFRNYPSNSTYSPDFDLIMSLQDSEESFLVWLCGGRRGSTYFRYTLRGFRLKDVYQMQVTKPLKLEYTSNVYINPLNSSVSLEESI